MASRAEQYISRALRAVLADLPTTADIPESESFRNVLNGLEYFVHEVLVELYPSCQALDGVASALARKVGPDEMEIMGICWLMDQSIEPIYVRLQLAQQADEISWFECHLGERSPSKWPKGISARKALHKAYERAYVKGPEIEWLYKVTFGERRVAVHSVRSARQPERQVEMTTSCGVKLRQESVSHRRLA